MPRTISESDWKLLRQLHPIALERFCQRALSDIDRLVSDTTKTAHERYLALFKLIKPRDRELAAAFDGLSRSSAMRQLACMQSYELLTEKEMSRFSSQTRETVQFLVGLGRS